MIKFSIIIACYNGEKYIDNCIKNVLKQTYNNYEIILIDDGSTDNTQEVVKKYKDVKCYKINHQGVSAARNYGIEKSSGEYFIFIDVDDYVKEDMLEILSNNIKEKPDMIKFGYNIVNENNEIINIYIDEETNVISGEEAFKILCNKKVPFDMICIYVYNKKYWINNKYKFKKGCYHEDFGIIPYALLKANKVKILNYVPYYYVQTNNSITRNDDEKKSIKKSYDFLRHYDYLFDKVNNGDFNNYIKKIFNSYIANGAVLKMLAITGNERKKYIKELRKRNVFNNVSNKTKRVILKINPNLYCVLMKVIK